MKVLAVIVVILLLTGTLLMARSVASDNSNLKTIDGPIYKSWYTFQLTDTFFGNEIDRSASHFSVGKKGVVSYKCSDRVHIFTAVTRPLFSVDEVLKFKKTDVYIKVDDGPIIGTTTNKYPHIVDDPDTVIKVRNLFRTGSEAIIRTVYGHLIYTYTLELEGFNSASEWVEDGCAESNS